ncbi:MAG: YfhO family protein [Chloroflexi bacterium]|nr:YfhO family protein [Chloroflexota bacterium]MBL7201062.1 YfhO family protein [Anaerolineae bacterium]
MLAETRTRQGPKRKRSLRADAIAVALLCALVLTFYSQIALSNLIMSGVDAFTYFYPYRAYAAQAIRSGQIPLWNPYLFMGVPFLANSQSAVFYPFNLALCWLSAPKLVAWSLVLHVTLAAVFAYLYARKTLRLSIYPALLGASAFALGGFLSGQAEHINQLNVSAWFPLLLLLWDRRGGRRWAAPLAMGIVFGLGLLAGHAQSSYISMLGLGTYATLPALKDAWRALRRQISWHSPLQRMLSTLLQLGLVALVGAGLAGVQILPTLELSRFSLRGAGLSYREAVSFSLKPLPRLLRFTFLPPWGQNLADVFGGSFFTEYLAYVGLTPLLWAALATGVLLMRGRSGGSASEAEESRRGAPSAMLLLAGVGAFLALGLYNPFYPVLYKVVPGFSLFRVPARWLFLYAFGAAMLSGLGLQQAMDWLRSRRAATPSFPWKKALPILGPLSVAIAAVELYAAAQALPTSHPTAPEAFSSLRTAPAHILAAQSLEVAPGRFLSMSDILFDPGDLREMERMYRDRLSERQVYDLIVSAKRKEIIAPNLPLAWQIYAVDGYDGGVLPLARYIHLQRLLLDESEIGMDGRLREGLKRIPSSRLLSLLGVRYVITDKVHDIWIDDVFYDLAFDAVLGAGTPRAAVEPGRLDHTATGLGIVSYLENAQAVSDGAPVAEIHLTTDSGETMTVLLRAGRDTSEGLYGENVAHGQARIGRRWPEQAEGTDYVTRLSWRTPVEVARLGIEALPFGGSLHIRGITLIDERDGSSVPLLLPTEGRFRQVHSGDVKIYEVLDALPRAYVVHQTRVIADDELALEAMASPSYDPARTAILAGGQEIDQATRVEPRVTVTAYDPEQIVIEATLSAPGYLVLSDAWYPGWHATVNGEPASIERANVHFRAVSLPEGTHVVRFTYRPRSYTAGLALSTLTSMGVLVGAIWSIRKRR